MDLTDNVIQLNSNKKYYRLRTNYGDNFHTFYENSFIAIGFNYIGAEIMNSDDKNATHKLIAKNEDLDLSNKNEKRKISRIYNVLQIFKDLKLGDVIVIPSMDSDVIAFGEIIDNEIYQSIEGSLECDYIKRRKVKWFKKVYWNDLDAKLIPLKFRGDIINDVTDLSEEIDIVMRNLFIKDDLSHLVFDIKKTEPIKLVEILLLLENIKDLCYSIIEDYNLNEDINDITIKLNLQSPGKTELINLGKSILFVAAMINLNSCNLDNTNLSPAVKQEILDLNNKYQVKVDSISNVLDNMKVPKQSLDFYKK